MLPTSLQFYLHSFAGLTITQTRPLSGGDINHAAWLQCSDGRQLFLKYNRSGQAADMLRKEKLGLALLGASRVIAVPPVRAQGEAPNGWAFLLTDYIVPGRRNRRFWADFGESLAALHGSTSAQFGFSHDNYIGSLPQSNTRCDTWSEFYAAARLLPQLRLAREQALLDSTDARQLEMICRKLTSICPEEPPALIHGDLWSGSFLCNAESKPVLIDPAACYAHREMDIAMTRLFGGFDPVFYESYEASRPLSPGFEDRLEIYQLYYLLVHLNLFGSGYAAQLRSILKRFT